MDDRHLLDEYAKKGVESAFEELIQRHLDLVYSTAMRQLGDPHIAQEVSQAVFCLLAKKAATFPNGILLGGWLYQTTCFKSLQFRRAEFRRRKREQEAACVNLTSPEDENSRTWEQLAPLLDAAVQELEEIERQAVVLRFFERKPFKDVGNALNLDDDAARKRVNRAVAKMRSWFETKGITCSEDALAVILLAYCTQPAPAGLAGIITKVALETAVAGALSSLVGTALKSTIMTKSTVAIASAAILALSIPSIVLWRQNQNLRREMAELIEKSEKSEQGRFAALASAQGTADELARLRSQQTELLRLRDEVAQSRRLMGDNKNKPAASETRLKSNPEASNPVPKTFEASFDARIPSGQTLVVGGWQTQPGKRAMALVVPTSIDAAGNVLDRADITTAAQVHIETTIIEMPDSLWSTLSLETLQAGAQALNQKTVLTQEKTRDMLTQLTQSDGVTILSSPRVTTLDGLKATISSGDVDNRSGQSLTYDPHFVAGENAFDMAIGLQMTNVSARVP